MICAYFSFSWNSNSAVASKSTDRSVNVLRRFFLNAFSARLSRFSTSASSKGVNSFSFSPVAGLIDAIAIHKCSASFPACDQTSHASEDARATLDPQAFWNQNVIEQIEKPLHQQRQKSRRDGAFQNCYVIIQVEAAQD